MALRGIGRLRAGGTNSGVLSLIAGYSSGLAVSAAQDTMVIRESDVITYSGVPYGKFSPDLSAKHTFNGSGVLGIANRLFITQTKSGSIPLPDGQGGDPGEGFTCTGLCWDGSAFWLGNDGGNIEGDSSRSPSIVRVSMGGVKLQEIDIGTLYSDQSSVQGVAYDSSDGTLWVAQITSGKVRHLTTAGVDLADGFDLASVNGLAYDSLRDRLWCSVSNELTLRTKAGVVEATYTLGAASWDGLYYDAYRDYIWFTDGINSAQGQATAFLASDGTQVGVNAFTDATAIEGIAIVNGNFYIAHDGYYHAASGAVIETNEIQIYPAVDGNANVAWKADHNPLDRTLLGYPFEMAYERLSGSPEDIGGSGWTATNGTATRNAAAPDGTTTATTFQANAGTFAVRIVENGTMATGAALQKVIAKAGTYQYLWLGDRGDVAGIRSATFDLTNKTVVGNSNGTGRIEEMADGRLLCWLEYTRVNAGSGAVTIALGNSTHSLDYPSKVWAGTENIIVWDAELANSAFPTSPLPVNATSTRDADTPSLATSEFDWSATENSIVIEATTARGAGTQTLFQAGDADDGVTIYRNSSNEIHVLVKVATVTQADLNLGAVANRTSFKVAVRAKADDYAASLNGGAVVTDTSGTFPTVTEIRLGNSSAGEQWNGWIKTLTVVPEAMTDATLILKST